MSIKLMSAREWFQDTLYSLAGTYSRRQTRGKIGCDLGMGVLGKKYFGDTAGRVKTPWDVS